MPVLRKSSALLDNRVWDFLHIGVKLGQKTQNFGSTITARGISFELALTQYFCTQIWIPNAVKQLKRPIGYVQFFQ